MTTAAKGAPIPPNQANFASWEDYRQAWDDYLRDYRSLAGINFHVDELPAWESHCEAWRLHWLAEGQPWRTQPEQIEDWEFWQDRLEIPPDETLGRYPLSNKGKMPLERPINRATIEKLIATHKRGNWINETLVPSDRRFRTEGLDLRGADLSGLDLSRLPLFETRGGLERVAWDRADKRKNEKEKQLAAICLNNTNLWRADLRRASLRSAELMGADLRSARLEGATLHKANLAASDLRGAHFDTSTNLNDVVLGNSEVGFARLADVRWSGVNLSVINWEHVKVLGDEEIALEPCERDENDKCMTNSPKDVEKRVNEFTEAIRANRQLSTELRQQGLDGIAVRFSYRAQTLQRKSLKQQFWHDDRNSKKTRFLVFFAYVFSLLLDGLVGYGYRLKRPFFWYVAAIVAFAMLYYRIDLNGPSNLTFGGALQVSLLSFHGRGIFPGFPSGQEMELSSSFVLVTAIEGAVGLVLEAVFIAAFTQRLLSR